MTTLRGYVDHIIYSNPQNAYMIISLSITGDIPEEIEDEVDGQDRFTCTGMFFGLSEGESIEVSGEYVNRPNYGMQLDVKSFSVINPETKDEIYRYLAGGAVHGIGAGLAAKIMERFGEDSFRVMEEEPERLAEIRGISERMAQSIAEQMVEKREQRSAVIFLSRYGITGQLALRIYRQYGYELYDVVETNPYRMAEEVRGVGFKIADDIAARNGISVDSEYRVRSGILYVMTLAAGRGSTYLPIGELIKETSDLLRVTPDFVESNILNLAVDRKLIVKGEEVYESRYYRMEENSAMMLRGLDEEFAVPEGVLDLEIEKLETAEEMSLDIHQKEAVKCAATHGVTILTGGPGTGKTTTIRAIIRYFENEGLDIFLAAPTGRAAKRMGEATGREAGTIHRMLEVAVRSDNDNREEGESYSADRSYFGRNADNPLEADVIIIDEVSMVDITLLYSLLRAISVGTRLILVGDIDQLPSVGPGQVLKDIIDSGCFFVVRLETVFRQSESSDIIKNSHLIRQGLPLSFEKKSSDFFVIKRYSAGDVIAETKRYMNEKLAEYVEAKVNDIQVLTPTRLGELGVDKLNRELQEKLNPLKPGMDEQGFGDRVFRVGDKVMQTKNNYQIEWEIRGKHDIAIEKGEGIFNGDMGIIRRIDKTWAIMEIEFDEGRIVEYPFKQADELDLAYAVTVHKAQGSEYPAVIIPLLGIPRPLINRNLLYTAVTRAKKCVIIIGDDKVFGEMIRNKSSQVRYSGLKKRLTERVIRSI